MGATVAGIHLGLDIHTNRPAGNAVPDGSLYSCSTHSLVYKSNYAGNSWATWTTLGATAATYHGCKIYNDGTQSINSGSSTALMFGAEEWDTDSLHDTGSNTSRITCAAGLAGNWRFSYKVTSGINATHNGIAFLRLNGVNDTHNVIGSATKATPNSISGSQWAATIDVVLAVSDYVELFIYQDSGGAILFGSALSSRGDVNILSATFLGA
jgi:hypothetical protein